MQTLSYLRTVSLGLALIATGCKHYSSFREVHPSYQSITPAGQLIAQAHKHPAKQPEARIGSYLDAAATATAVLEAHPENVTARRDYNFAVGRIFEIIHEASLEPWKAPLQCPGSGKVWNLLMKSDPLPERNPANYSFLPADRYKFKGSLVVQSRPKDGLGAPLVAVSKDDFNPIEIDPYAQGKHLFYGVTGLLAFEGNNCTAYYADPLATETVPLGGHTFQLAADFVAPIAMALAELKPREKEIEGFLNPDEFASRMRLARLQPYDPNKIPILCVHGLGDSQATWAPLIETLRSDRAIRENYQFWFFSYPTGFPYPLSAAVLRKDLDAINARYPGHKPIVVLGHSMGGMISRTLITDSGMTLWNATFDKSPAEMPFSDETRKIMTEALIFQHRLEISRVVFLSPSHRGADMATSFLGRVGSKLIGSPKNMLPDDTKLVSLAKTNSTGEQVKKMPNSIDLLDPKNRFVTTLAELPLAKGIPYHSILGDRGKGGNLSHEPPVSTDGIVPYWSSHLDGAQSELIIPSYHWTNQHPLGIAEVKRILLAHLGTN